MGIGEPYVGKVYVDYRIKRHTPLPVLYISPPPTLLNFFRPVVDKPLTKNKVNYIQLTMTHQPLTALNWW